MVEGYKMSDLNRFSINMPQHSLFIESLGYCLDNNWLAVWNTTEYSHENQYIFYREHVVGKDWTHLIEFDDRYMVDMCNQNSLIKLFGTSEKFCKPKGVWVGSYTYF